MIRKQKIQGMWVGDEKTLMAKTGPNKGAEFTVCSAGFFAPDDDKDFGGKFIGISISGRKDKTPKQVAEDLKKEIQDAKENGGKEFWLDITISDKKDKDGNNYVNAKFLSKAQREVAEQMAK